MKAYLCQLDRRLIIPVGIATTIDDGDSLFEVDGGRLELAHELRLRVDDEVLLQHTAEQPKLFERAHLAHAKLPPEVLRQTCGATSSPDGNRHPTRGHVRSAGVCGRGGTHACSTRFSTIIVDTGGPPEKQCTPICVPISVRT